MPTTSISTLGLRLLVHRITWHCKATQKKPLHNKQSLTWNPLISITITLIILLVNPKSGPCYSEQRQPYSQQPSSSLLQTSQDKKYIQDQGRGWTCFLFLSFQLKLQKTAWLYVKIQPVGNPRILVQTNKNKNSIIILVTSKPSPCYTEQRQPHSSLAQACFKQAKPRNIYETKGVGKWTCFLFLSFRLKLQKRLGASGRQQSILYVVQSTPASGQ